LLAGLWKLRERKKIKKDALYIYVKNVPDTNYGAIQKVTMAKGTFE